MQMEEMLWAWYGERAPSFNVLSEGNIFPKSPDVQEPGNSSNTILSRSFLTGLQLMKSLAVCDGFNLQSSLLPRNQEVRLTVLYSWLVPLAKSPHP